MESLRQFDREHLRTRRWLCGVDEAGRGALAGPVVAGAVFAGKAFFEERGFKKRWGRVNDSKQLKPARRREIFDQIREAADRGLLFWASGEATVDEIAQLNILGATRRAMQQAIEQACPAMLPLPEARQTEDLFHPAPAPVVSILVDGRPLKPFPYPHEGVVKGDQRSFLIALASIIAKETRDAVMVDLARQHTAFGFEIHKGYGTSRHRIAIVEEGPCPEHRLLFLRKLSGTGSVA